MRLVLVDRLNENRIQFYPLVLGRPLWELRCGMTSLEEKLVARIKPDDVAYFVPDYMANYYKTQTNKPVNDLKALEGEDLILVDTRIKADSFDIPDKSQVGLNDEGQLLYARMTKEESKKISAVDIEQFIAGAKANLPNEPYKAPTWQYTWDLVLANPEQITEDFKTAGRSGIEGDIEEPSAIRGDSRT